MKKIILVKSLLITIYLLFATINFSIAATYTETNATSASINLESTAFNVNIGGAGEYITEVSIAITFQKVNGTCAAPGSGDTWNEEIAYRIVSPIGTSVLLIEDDSHNDETYDDRTTHAGTVTVTLIDSAGTLVGTAPNPEYPVTGTFQPINPLSAFNDEDPSGTWTLYADDWGNGDELCHQSFTLTVTTADNIPTLSEWGMILMGLLLALMSYKAIAGRRA